MERTVEKTSEWKIATALAGPGTLSLEDGARGRMLQKSVESRLRVKVLKKGHFATHDEHVCTTLRCIGCADMSQSVREAMAAEIEDAKPKFKVVQVGWGECAVFKVESVVKGDAGESTYGAMHSEPKMDRDRVFVHVVPGTEAELRELMRGWEMPYPRQWSVGVLEKMVNLS